MNKLTDGQLNGISEFSSTVAKEVLSQGLSATDLLQKQVLLQSRSVRLQVEIVRELRRNPWIRAIGTWSGEMEDLEEEPEGTPKTLPESSAEEIFDTPSQSTTPTKPKRTSRKKKSQDEEK